MISGSMISVCERLQTTVPRELTSTFRKQKLTLTAITPRTTEKSTKCTVDKRVQQY
jgi:hypothetical protein